MYKCRFTLSDDTEEFEGYTDGSTWNKWDNVAMTREQVEKFLDTTPYDYRFVPTKQEDGKVLWTQLIVYWDSGLSTYPSSPIPLDDNKTILEGWFIDDLEFMVVE